MQDVHFHSPESVWTFDGNPLLGSKLREAAAVPTTVVPTAAIPTTGVPTTAPDPHLRAKSAPDSTYRKRRNFQGGRQGIRTSVPPL